jgi:putative phosphoesterase
VINIRAVTVDTFNPGKPRRIGVLGDIHCEDIRLETALRFFNGQQIDLICSVGDIVDGMGDPNRTVELLMKHGVVCVRGNHERWLAKDEMRHLPDSNSCFDFKMAEWEFVTRLPLWLRFETVAGRMLLCHGLGEDDMAGVWPFDDVLTLHSNYALWKLVNSHEYDFVINGHTHRRLVRSFDDLTIINAGTLYREHDPCFLIVDFETCVAEYFNLPGGGGIVEAEKIQFR